MALKMALVGVTFLLLSLSLLADANNKNTNNRRPAADVQRDIRAMHAIGDSNHKFTFDVYKSLARTPGNIFFSPLSIHSILTMLSLGAKDNTLEQIKQGLHLPDSAVAQNGYRQLNKVFRSTVDKGVNIKVANKMYVARKFQLKETFSRATKDNFNTITENVDFSNGEKVRNDVNQWVESNTNRKIKDVVPSGTLSSDTAMLLVNAVYFKGKWHTEFDPANSTDGFFNGHQGREPVRFMDTTSEFAHQFSRKLNARSVELPYNGDKFSMVIILPIKKEGFAQMEEALATADVRDFTPSEHDKFNIHVKLPKFKIEKSTPLAATLQELGMTDMFTSSADLSGLASGGPGLKVSKVLHKAFVEVNEEGSEAAATTVLAVQTLSLNSDDNRAIDFIVDQPFMFLIRHRESGNILFMGRCTTIAGEEGVDTSPPLASTSGQSRNPGRNPAGSASRGNGQSATGTRNTQQQVPFDVRSGTSQVPVVEPERQHFAHEGDQQETNNYNNFDEK